MVDLLARVSVDVHKSFIDAAIDAGVKRFIPSEFSGNMNNEHNVAIITLFADRITIRDYLKLKSTDNAWFSYTTVSTGPFYDWVCPDFTITKQRWQPIAKQALKASFIGFDLPSQSATIYDDGNQPFSVTTLSSVAKAVVGILSHPAETSDRNVYISSFTPTQNEVLAVLEEVTESSWTKSSITTDDAKAQGYEKLGKGDMSGFGQVLMASTYGPTNGNDFTKHAVLSNDLLGLPKEDLKIVTKAVIEGREVWVLRRENSLMYEGGPGVMWSGPKIF